MCLYGLNNINSTLVPSEETLELLQSLTQNDIIPNVFRNIETIVQDKCPETFSSLRSWQKPFLQKSKLTYLKTSKLSNFFGSEKEINDVNEEKKYRCHNVYIPQIFNYKLLTLIFNPYLFPITF